MQTAESKPYQLIMPLAIYNASDISATSKLILTEIFNLFKAGNKQCYASNGHFAEMFNLKKTTVSMSILQLQKRGWIISKAYKLCEIENCSLKQKGWHRHIIAGNTLSNILDSLSNQLNTLSKKEGYPIQSLGTIRRTGKNNIENNNNTDEKFKKEIDKITTWAYKRAKANPSCNEDSFRRIVSEAIQQVGYEKIHAVYAEEDNAISFLTKIKRL